MRYEYDTVEELVASYRDDLDNDHRLAERTYTAPAGVGEMIWHPHLQDGQPGGPVTHSWLLTLLSDDIDVSKRGTLDDGPLTADSLTDLIDALTERAKPVAAQAAGELLDTIRDTRRQLTLLDQELRATVERAHKAGAQKINIADAAGITRATLDRWLAL